jgi:hypothetical protein
VGVAAALIGGVALLWRRSRPVSVLAICVSAYAVNAVMVPGVPPYTGWLALYAAGAHDRQAARAWYAAAAGTAALVAVFAACALLYPKTLGARLGRRPRHSEGVGRGDGVVRGDRHRCSC